MRIFLTGGTGFIGSKLVEKLIKQGYETYILCRNVTDRIPALPKEANIIWGDLIDPHHLKKSVHDINPNIKKVPSIFRLLFIIGKKIIETWKLRSQNIQYRKPTASAGNVSAEYIICTGAITPAIINLNNIIKYLYD